jgi:hypothetical protein
MAGLFSNRFAPRNNIPLIAIVSKGQRLRITGWGKTAQVVIPFTANAHGETRPVFAEESLFFVRFNRRGIPHFVRNDGMEQFFRAL